MSGEEAAEQPLASRPAGLARELREGLGPALRGAASARVYALWFLLLLSGFIAWQALLWPIIAVDTDLWYHLSAGRYIVSQGALPHDAFFSFLQPSPQWLDYYWLSQLLFYGTHALAGYPGLVVLRALILLALLGAVLAILRQGRGSAGLPYSAFIFALVALFVIPRFSAIRPHELSYLMIALFVLLLESRRGLVFLPLLALLWVNLHGVEFPVLLAIVGAYAGEQVLARLWPGAGLPRMHDRALILLAASVACVLVTPHGLQLLASPFSSFALVSQYIEELRPVDPATLAVFSIDGLLITRESVRTLLLGLAVVAALVSLRPGALRPAHLVLFVAGLVLLLRMRRFSIEFVLLALPLLGSLPVGARGRAGASNAPGSSGSPRASWLPLPVRAGLWILLALLPFRYVHGFFATDCRFPVCSRDLPEGAVAFLSRVGATGPLLNHPNQGGYLEWEVYPRQKIFADLQTPFLFPDAVIYRAEQMFRDPVVFGGVLEEYRPSFVLAPRSHTGFADVIAGFPDWLPVFVDDASVLYANGAAHPELADRFGLRAIDPARLRVLGSPGDSDAYAQALQELRRINEIHPHAGRTRIFEGALRQQQGDVEAALRLASELIADFPTRPEAFRLRGDALLAREDFAGAADAYRGALARLKEGDAGDAAQRVQLQGRLWTCYSRLDQPQHAYRALRSAFDDVYSPSVGYRELFSLGSAALDAGERDQARSFLELALIKAPEDPTWRERIRARLEQAR